jgi:hypothetical protein
MPEVDTSGMTILDILKWVLPDGTVLDSTGWDDVCEWPPDLFAVVAAITERSGLYSERKFMAYWDKQNFELTKAWIKQVCDAGEAWSTQASPPDFVQELWQNLIKKHRNARIDDASTDSLAWKSIVFKLLAIADEASGGVGFPPISSKPAIQYTIYRDYIVWEQKREADQNAIGGELLPYLPHSICIRVPPAVLCVQPKTNTPKVGCTVRSLTHNLALLPSVANVSTSWQISNKPRADLAPFNILVVPFPFSIPGKSFVGSENGFPSGSTERAFRLDPDVWMRGAKPEQFAEELICELIKSSEPEVDQVHAIVLPETALRKEFADKVAEILLKKTDLDLFITGVVSGHKDDARNMAAMYRFVNKEKILSSFQSKHHRWCLDGDQIRRYHLGHVMDPHSRWWEQIDVSYRNCYVTVFRPGATVSVLICEDLARYDPVLTVMNAIGPNLVVALLMDGPQLEHRWPGRYATVLADDPGSAVLTVTSLGMVSRSAMPGDTQNREIALWKESDGKAKALRLPKGDHALLLTLTSQSVEQFTLDGRGDGGYTVHFGLGAAHGVRHPTPPAWLGPRS